VLSISSISFTVGSFKLYCPNGENARPKGTNDIVLDGKPGSLSSLLVLSIHVDRVSFVQIRLPECPRCAMFLRSGGLGAVTWDVPLEESLLLGSDDRYFVLLPLPILCLLVTRAHSPESCGSNHSAYSDRDAPFYYSSAFVLHIFRAFSPFLQSSTQPHGPPFPSIFSRPEAPVKGKAANNSALA
jgi:hypothetical protein